MTRLWRLALLSGAVALLGYGFALWPQRYDHSLLPVLMVVLAAMTAMATAWAVIVRRAGECWIRSSRVTRPGPVSADR